MAFQGRAGRVARTQHTSAPQKARPQPRTGLFKKARGAWGRASAAMKGAINYYEEKREIRQHHLLKGVYERLLKHSASYLRHVVESGGEVSEELMKLYHTYVLYIDDHDLLEEIKRTWQSRVYEDENSGESIEHLERLNRWRAVMSRLESAFWARIFPNQEDGQSADQEAPDDEQQDENEEASSAIRPVAGVRS
ncbi:MAG: hypothetical protein AAGJ35_00125 [Myxococcota bacterium]